MIKVKSVRLNVMFKTRTSVKSLQKIKVKNDQVKTASVCI